MGERDGNISHLIIPALESAGKKILVLFHFGGAFFNSVLVSIAARQLVRRALRQDNILSTLIS